MSDIIGQLETYEDQYEPRHVVPGSIVLLNLFPDLPERQRSPFEFDVGTIVRRVVYRLVRSLRDPIAIEAAVRSVLPDVETLCSKMELIRIVGHREGVGHRLIAEDAASNLEREWRHELCSIGSDRIAKEREPLRAILTAKREADSAEEQFVVDDSPALTLALLRNARSETLSQTFGNRAVRRTERLAWDALIEVYGGEPILRERIERVKLLRPDGFDDLLALADRYLNGWRPEKDV